MNGKSPAEIVAWRKAMGNIAVKRRQETFVLAPGGGTTRDFFIPDQGAGRNCIGIQCEIEFDATNSGTDNMTAPLLEALFSNFWIKNPVGHKKYNYRYPRVLKDLVVRWNNELIKNNAHQAMVATVSKKTREYFVIPVTIMGGAGTFSWKTQYVDPTTLFATPGNISDVSWSVKITYLYSDMPLVDFNTECATLDLAATTATVNHLFAEGFASHIYYRSDGETSDSDELLDDDPLEVATTGISRQSNIESMDFLDDVSQPGATNNDVDGAQLTKKYEQEIMDRYKNWQYKEDILNVTPVAAYDFNGFDEFTFIQTFFPAFLV